MKLSDETLENLLVALVQATDDHGASVHIPPDAAFTDLILAQLPAMDKYYWKEPTHG